MAGRWGAAPTKDGFKIPFAPAKMFSVFLNFSRFPSMFYVGGGVPANPK